MNPYDYRDVYTYPLGRAYFIDGVARNGNV